MSIEQVVKKDLGWYWRRVKLKVGRSAMGPKLRQMSNSKRVMPTFLIVGAQKAGTTFLHNNLARHAQVLEPWFREVHYFDKNYDKGPEWYRAFFPLAETTSDGLACISGESSPSYMFDRYAPERIAKMLPDAKIIAVLRDPTSRAVSQYQMGYFQGKETLTFREALTNEEDRLQRMIAGDESVWKEKYYYHAYRSRGLYLMQIKRLQEHFPKENLLILESGWMWKNPKDALVKVEQFIGLPEWTREEIFPENTARVKAHIDEDIIEELREFFRPHNQALFEHLGWDQVWK